MGKVRDQKAAGYFFYRKRAKRNRKEAAKNFDGGGIKQWGCINLALPLLVLVKAV